MGIRLAFVIDVTDADFGVLMVGRCVEIRSVPLAFESRVYCKEMAEILYPFQATHLIF